MSRIYLDSEGKPYVPISKPIIRYQTTEKVTDSEGKVIGSRVVEKEKTEPDIKDYDLEKHGWFKKLTWRALVEIKGFDKKPKSSLLVPKTGLFVVSFRLDANKMSPCTCNNSSTHIYLTIRPSGIFKTCANCGITTGSLSTDSSRYQDTGIEKIDEREVTPREAISLYQKGFIHFVDIALGKRLFGQNWQM